MLLLLSHGPGSMPKHKLKSHDVTAVHHEMRRKLGEFRLCRDYLWEMGKAVLDILHQAIQPGGPHPL